MQGVSVAAKPKPHPGTYRCTFSLPKKLAVDVAYVAKRIGVSQSALLSQIVAAPMADLRTLVEQVPVGTTTLEPGEARRLRGSSAKLVHKRVQEALGQFPDDGGGE